MTEQERQEAIAGKKDLLATWEQVAPDRDPKYIDRLKKRIAKLERNQ